MQDNRINFKDSINEVESGLLLNIAMLVRIAGAIGLVYAVSVTLVSLYRVISVVDNSKMWSYYKTIPGFFSILFIIGFGLVVGFVGWHFILFGKFLRYSVESGKQHYFDAAWKSFNRCLIVLGSSIVLFILFSLITGFMEAF